MRSSVAEIHRYPLRPEGFEEPLFAGRACRREVGEHLLRAPWLSRASELEGGDGQAARAARAPLQVERRCGGRFVRTGGRWRRVVAVLTRWREVGRWWDEGLAADRFVVRALLSDGAVVDLARERGGWFLVGVVD